MEFSLNIFKTCSFQYFSLEIIIYDNHYTEIVLPCFGPCIGITDIISLAAIQAGAFFITLYIRHHWLNCPFPSSLSGPPLLRGIKKRAPALVKSRDGALRF